MLGRRNAAPSSSAPLELVLHWNGSTPILGCIGKGTQAPIIKEEYCLCHLSTGDMLREAVKAGTEMGKKAKAVMDAGKLVSDDIVAGIVAEAIKAPECSKGNKFSCK